MFGKKNKTLFDYVAEHNPYNDIDDMIKVSYPEGIAPQEHKELETMMDEYWDILHPLVCDMINSYANVIKSMMKDVEAARDNLENSRRQLTFEQQNVNDVTDELREMKGEMQNLLVVNRDLQTRLDDERTMMESSFKEERRTLEIIANSKLGDGADLNSIINEVKGNMVDNDEVKRLQTKIETLEAQIKKEREENEAIQGELSMSFMEKITRYDEMIKNLKKRLNED